MDGTFTSGAGDAATPAAANNPTNIRTKARLIGVDNPAKCAAAIHRRIALKVATEGRYYRDFRRGRQPFLAAFARFSRAAVHRGGTPGWWCPLQAGSASACSRLRS